METKQFEKKLDTKSTNFMISYSFGQLSDVIGYQMFTFLIFTFYYAIIGLNVNWITIGFIIWSVWNAFNDPMVGYISDRLNTKWGRRKPLVYVGIIPLLTLMVLLWTPPLNSKIISFIYFIIIILAFDTAYTSFSMGQATLFPELFKNLEERAKANNIRQIFTIFGLIIAFIMPTFFIPKLTNPQYIGGYILAGIVAMILMGFFGIIFIIFGLKEPKEFSEDYKDTPPFFTSLKISLKRKSFKWYVLVHFVNWYVYGMLPTILPLFAEYVLGIGEGETFYIGLLLGVTFISACIFIALWKYVAIKIGIRKGFMISMLIFIITLFPNLFINNVIQGFIVFFLIGIGLAGSLFFLDITIAAVMDEDELETGVRRAGGIYGISTFILRFATIFMFLTISLVFNSTGWTVFDPIGTVNTQLGLRILIFVFPAIALIIGILGMYKFPITVEKYTEMKKELRKLHEHKLEKIRNT